jgi:hypothetical protein
MNKAYDPQKANLEAAPKGAPVCQMQRGATRHQPLLDPQRDV